MTSRPNLVIWCSDSSSRRACASFHITLTYVVSFLVLNSLRATLLHQPRAPEIAPITGPMYQLFVFFMITDPRTSYGERRWQIIVAGARGGPSKQRFRFGSDQVLAHADRVQRRPAFLALAIVAQSRKRSTMCALRRHAAQRGKPGNELISRHPEQRVPGRRGHRGRRVVD
jgi:hypothetical protein